MEENYSFPYFLIHRGDLHQILLQKALEIGVTIKINSFVSAVNDQEPSVTLADGTVYRADLVIGADGIHSKENLMYGFAKHETQASNLVYEERS
jgi:salicylate hydroxylase